MYLSLSIEHEVLNLDSTWTRSCYRQETCKYRIVINIDRRKCLCHFVEYERLKGNNTVRVNQIVTIFLIESSIHILDQNRYPVDTSLIHIESRKPPTAELFDVDSGRISIVTVNTKEYYSDVLAVITRIIRRTLVIACKLDDVQQLFIMECVLMRFLIDLDGSRLYKCTFVIW
ncbi:hypothetical protein Tco_0628163 [Tanacetum coccineum]|uniref:Uncharacterized protein n=1 Tax=Tanacetum coccineum TaxID=301880 RepID=A0ABQ4WPJ0_9ASTR